MSKNVGGCSHKRRSLSKDVLQARQGVSKSWKWEGSNPAFFCLIFCFKMSKN